MGPRLVLLCSMFGVLLGQGKAPSSVCATTRITASRDRAKRSLSGGFTGGLKQTKSETRGGDGVVIGTSRGM